MKANFKSLIPTAVLAAMAGFCGLHVAGAAPVDLSSTPMVSGLSKAVPPNIYFILDDSGSMDDENMPDAVSADINKNCFRNWGRNKIYYNPNITYVVPKKADGTDYPNQTYNNAKVNGFDLSASAAKVDLSKTVFSLVNNPFAVTNGSKTVTVTHNNHGFTSGTVVSFAPSTTFRNVTVSGSYTIASVTTNTYTIVASTAANATDSTNGGNGISETSPTTYYYYDYTSAPTAPPSTCASTGSYTKVVPSTSAQQTNFANWYSYYRKRILMMKSASGRAFATIDDKYRVGFSTISEQGTAAAGFLNLKKFDATQKASWYSKLYSANPNGFTPLRGALSKAGRLYAGQLISGDNDPVQYSCQQNFTILTTDGYWNLTDESSTAPKYGPYRPDNTTAVGDQDGVSGTVRPYLDSGAYANTLADVAMYYYKNDLRTSATPLGGLLDDHTTRLAVNDNNVPTAGADTATWQHMTTYTIGLGVSGTLTYREDYLTCNAADASCDYGKILQGTKNWPNPDVTNTSSTVTTRIDDLWHAAVNGRGQYLSASNPDTVVSALSKTLASISVSTAAAASAATSTLEPVAGDRSAYVAQYTTGFWYGDLQSRAISLTTGALSATADWSAQTQLSSKVSTTGDTRTIMYFSPAATGKLKNFTSANLTADGINLNVFASGASNPGGALAQYTLWTAAQQSAATTDEMIAFLRGKSGFEDESGNTNRLFRDRTYVLGDIVDSSPVFVKKPPFKYTDAGYATFASNNATRTPVVYVGANDGMLHAFNAETGAEMWAYIPTAVIPNLYKLADTTYASNHRYYVNGPTTVGDAYDGTAWKTVLVGSLGGGGKAVYALDVTDPASPKALWEFGTAQDGDMGYSYGNPVITKRASDGRWVALITSGYNNTGGDSKGRLFVLDAFTGARLAEIITDNAVTNPDVSGIGKINNFVLNTLADNSTQYVYGGDLGGALWRFDINNNTSQRLGETSATVGNQPITVRPELARIRDNSGNYYRVVYFGTGRYLGLNDLTTGAPSSAIAQGIYAVKDTGADLGTLTASGANLVEQTLVVDGNNPRRIPNPLAVDWLTKNGWYVTLPVGERVNVDVRLQLGSFVVLANVPLQDYCTVGGISWLYQFDYKTGTANSAQVNGVVSQLAGNALGVGLTLYRLPNNKLIALGTLVSGFQQYDIRIPPPGALGATRVGWREIF